MVKFVHANGIEFRLLIEICSLRFKHDVILFFEAESTNSCHRVVGWGSVNLAEGNGIVNTFVLEGPNMFAQICCSSRFFGWVLKILFMIPPSQLPAFLSKASVEISVTSVSSYHRPSIYYIARNAFATHYTWQVGFLAITIFLSCVVWLLNRFYLLIVS